MTDIMNRDSRLEQFSHQSFLPADYTCSTDRSCLQHIKQSASLCHLPHASHKYLINRILYQLHAYVNCVTDQVQHCVKCMAPQDACATEWRPPGGGRLSSCSVLSVTLSLVSCALYTKDSVRINLVQYLTSGK